MLDAPENLALRQVWTERRGGASMPFVEVFTREELSDAVRAKLAERRPPGSGSAK
jgi:hypothetical protein